MRDKKDIEQAIDIHGPTVWRVCANFFRAEQDAQDAFQEAFIKYALADSAQFSDEEHRKAWLIKVASNQCKDMLRASCRTDQSLNQDAGCAAIPAKDPAEQPGSLQSEVLDAFRSLDDPPRLPLYLAIYEGYTAPEIAKLLDAPVNTVYSWISRGRKMLKEALS